jgi:hypothetical protein
MTSKTSSVKVRPHQLGWLRRPELDTESTDAWELPDGTLFAAEKNKEPELEILRVPISAGDPDDAAG